MSSRLKSRSAVQSSLMPCNRQSAATLASWIAGPLELRDSQLLLEARAPKFLGDPRHTCPGHRPRWSLPEQASGASPLRLALSVLPSKPSDSSASTNPIFRGPIPQPACSLSTLRVGRCLPLTQDSLSAGGLALAERDFNPLGRLPGFSTLWLHTHLQDEACLAHGGAEGAAAAGAIRRGWAAREGACAGVSGQRRSVRGLRG